MLRAEASRFLLQHRDLTSTPNCPVPIAAEPGSLRTTGAQCQDFTGIWQTTWHDLTPLRIAQTGCTFQTQFDSNDHSFRHTLTADATANGATIVIDRINPAGCRTRMFGSMRLLPDGSLAYDLAGTTGNCDVPASYREHRVFIKR